MVELVHAKVTQTVLIALPQDLANVRISQTAARPSILCTTESARTLSTQRHTYCLENVLANNWCTTQYNYIPPNLTAIGAIPGSSALAHVRVTGNWQEMWMRIQVARTHH